MALTYEFLVERADQAANEAAAALLANVRERCLRAEKAWRDMATQTLEVTRSRELALQQKQAAVQWPGAPQ